MNSSLFLILHMQTIKILLADLKNRELEMFCLCRFYLGQYATLVITAVFSSVFLLLFGLSVANRSCSVEMQFSWCWSSKLPNCLSMQPKPLKQRSKLIWFHHYCCHYIVCCQFIYSTVVKTGCFDSLRTWLILLSQCPQYFEFSVSSEWISFSLHPWVSPPCFFHVFLLSCWLLSYLA